MSYDPISDLEARAASLEAEILEIGNKPTVTPAEDARLDAALAELDEVRSTIADAQAREDRLAGFRNQRPRVIVNERTVVSPVNVNTRTNPFDVDELRGVDPAKRATELRARAIDVIESRTGNFDHVTDAGREHAVRLLDEGDTVARDAAEYVIATGRPEYLRSFAAVIRDPASVSARMELERMGADLEARTALTTAGVAGALHAPFVLDPTLILTNDSVTDPIAATARTVTITGTDTWVAPTSAGVTAGLISPENSSFSDNTPTFTSNSVQTYMAGAFVRASFQSAEDSTLANEIGTLFRDAAQRLEAGYFATGSGSSQPQGLVTFCSNSTSRVAGTSGAAGSADLSALDIYNTRAHVPPRFRPQSVWYGSLPISYAIRQLGTSTSGDHGFTLTMAESDTLSLLGRPFYECSSMDSVVSSGQLDEVLIHGDPSQYVIVRRLGAVVNYIPVMQSGGLPLATSGWALHWRFGAAGMVQSAFAMLRL